MKIIIAGAGAVGSHLAKMLSNTNHDITVIDNDQARLKNVGSLFDILTLEGNASSIGILKEAKIKKADLFIAVTQSESVNIASSILASELGLQKLLPESTTRNTFSRLIAICCRKWGLII
jgi:trk system potassium uptake protein